MPLSMKTGMKPQPWRKKLALLPVDLLEGGIARFRFIYHRRIDNLSKTGPAFVNQFTTNPALISDLSWW